MSRKLHGLNQYKFFNPPFCLWCGAHSDLPGAQCVRGQWTQVGSAAYWLCVCLQAGPKHTQNSLLLVIRVEWCICFLFILKQKSSLSILNGSISLGKAFVYFSACKIRQNKSMGNRKPCVIQRTSITSSASSLPMFHQFTLLEAGRLDFTVNTVQRFSLVYELNTAVSL